MSGNIIGAIKAQTKFGSKEYKPGAMISKMNKFKSMPAKEVGKKVMKNVPKKGGAASGVGRLEKAGLKKTGTFKGKSNKLGGGGRFAQMVSKLSGKVKNPKAVAASIGRKSLGKKKFQTLAAKGKSSKTVKMKHVKIAKEVKNNGKKGQKALVKIQKSHVKGKIKS